MGSPVINPHISQQLIFDKETENINRVSLFFKWCWKTGQHMQKNKTLTSFTKINSKWMKNLNVRPVIMKFLEESIDSKQLDIGLSDFLGDGGEWNDSKGKEKNKDKTK